MPGDVVRRIILNKTADILWDSCSPDVGGLDVGKAAGPIPRSGIDSVGRGTT
jgi:hypothetical protein